MFRRLGWFVGLNYRSWSGKRLTDANAHPAKVKPVAMFDTIQEIAIYIHRFHNLDLFQQGWYQLKITMQWEDSESTSVETPARVVQYEGSDDAFGVWRIDNTDNSFYTQPFRIKYASDSRTLEAVANESFDGSTPATSQVASADAKCFMLVKSLLASRDILLEEL